MNRDDRKWMFRIEDKIDGINTVTIKNSTLLKSHLENHNQWNVKRMARYTAVLSLGIGIAIILIEKIIPVMAG